MSIKSALSTDQEKAAETGRFSGTAEIRAISGLIKLVGFRKKASQVYRVLSGGRIDTLIIQSIPSPEGTR
jgi:hypothetical protein